MNAGYAGGPGCTVALFIAGGTPRSATARRNLLAALDRLGPPAAAIRVDIVDVLRDPARALEAGLLATPSLLLVASGDAAQGRRRWFIGDLSRPELVSDWLVELIDPQQGP